MTINGNPFPGLRSFDRKQAHLFFGRDEQSRDLIARLKRHRFLPVVGMSGSGKSSLVRAGLIPALTGSYLDSETSGWRLAVLRPGRNPIQELAATLSSAFGVAQPEVLVALCASSAGLARVVQQHLRNNEKLLVLVDQFEELFRYRDAAEITGKKDDDTAFIKLLLAASGESEHPLPGLDDLPVYVVLTMRSDFIGKCSRFRGLPEALNHTQYLIPRLTREQQRDVIEGPIGMAGASIEPSLVQRLLNDLGDNPDQLPALQHALMRTWEQSAASRAEGKPIAIADYEAVGGMVDALNYDADQVYGPLSADRVTDSITRRMFQRLVHVGPADTETRRPTPISELIAVTAANEHDLTRVITIFQKRGFLTVSHDQDPIVDITHESLIRGWRQLSTWIQEEERSAATYRRLADAAALYEGGETSLLVDPQLQLTLNWREETKPNEAWAARYGSRFIQAMEFLEQSRKELHDARERAEQKRRSELSRAKARQVVLGTLLLIAIGASIIAAIQRRTATAERQKAVAEEQKAVSEREARGRVLYDSNIYFTGSAVVSGQPTLAQKGLDELLGAGLKELFGFEWFYLWRAVHAEKATLFGHSNYILSVAFSPDGKMLASGSGDRTVKLWDTVNQKELGTLSGHAGPVLAVKFSPDGRILASASADRTIKLWDIVDHKEPVTLIGHSSDIWGIAFSPDGKTLASASYDKTVKLWDLTGQREPFTFSGHASEFSTVAFSPDGKILASGDNDGNVILWDVAGRKELPALTAHSNAVWGIAFSPNGKLLAFASTDNTVELWDFAARKELATLSGHSDPVTSVAFSPDNRTLVSGSNDSTLKLWDIATHKEVGTLMGHSDGVRSVSFSPDGRTLASGSNDKTVKLWDATDRKQVTTLSGHYDSVLAVAFSPDGKMLASASDDNMVKLWDTTGRGELMTLSGHSDGALAVAFSPDGKMLASGGGDKTVKLWDISTQKQLATLNGHSEEVWSVAFSPDGKMLASASDDKTIKLWDIATRKELATLTGHSDAVTTVAFSPNGRLLASVSNDKTLKFWDTVLLKEVGSFTCYADSIGSLAFSPDGLTVASSEAKAVKLWNIHSGASVTLSGHRGYVYSVAFSPDGRTLASASDDKTVKLWDVASRKELMTLQGHSDTVESIAISPDGKIMASGSADKTVMLWFAATEQEVQAWRRPSD